MILRSLVVLSFALCAFSTSLPALAQSHSSLVPSEDEAPEPDWTGKGELGLAISKGNSDTQSFIAKFDLDYSDKHRKFGFGASAQQAEDDGKESAHRYELHGTGGWRLSKRSYIYGALRNERDHFSSYEYQWTTAAGYGYDAIRSDTHRLSFEIGPGYRFAKDQGLRLHHNEAIARGLVDWRYQLTDTAAVMNTLLLEAGHENTFVRNLFGVQVAMSKAMAMKAGLETRYNSEVDVGIEKTDQLTTVNLVYNFD